jgi:hypothetical protein
MPKNGYDFVVDCSITWLGALRTKSTRFTDQVLESLSGQVAIVPSIWPLEMANVLLLAKRHKSINEM